MVFEKFALLAINALGLFLGVSILLANKKSRQHRLFFLSSIVMMLWVDSSFLLDTTYDQSYVTLLGKINLALFVLFASVFYLFIKQFPAERDATSKRSILVFVLGITISFICLATNLVVKNIAIVGAEKEWLFSWGEWVLYGYSILIAFFIFHNLWLKYRASDRPDKIKINYFFASAAIFAIFNIIFNVVVPVVTRDDNLYFLGDYSIIFLLIFTGTAITKHRLFNIKVIATQTTVIIISLVLLVQTFLGHDIPQIIVQAIIWSIATYGGIILIRSMKTELRQKDELMVLAKKLDEANKHLEDLDEQKDNFISMASHELNTPIAAIEGYLSMIIDEKMAGEINEKAMKYLKNVYLSSKRLATLVHDLLNVSRIESNRIHVIYTQAQIEDVIDQAVAEVMIKVKEAGHTLEWQRPKKALPSTYLDVPRIIEVVINILGNAIKYTEPPGKIKILAQADKEKIVVSISDNGRGIPKEKYNHIFEKFSQVNVLTDQVKGTGLGMFISKNLIELHKGILWFTSSVDPESHGTTFYFSLPILKEKPFDEHEGEGALFAVGKKKDASTIIANKAASAVAAPIANTTPNPKPKVQPTSNMPAGK